MQLFLAFIRAFREYIIFLLLCIVSLLLISQSSSSPVQFARSVSIGLIGALQSTTGWIPGLLRSGNESEALKQVNLNLMEEVIQLRRYRQENQKLRRMLDFQARSKYSLSPAEIVGKNPFPGSYTFTINIGSVDSVLPPLPVITERGLVGKIIASSANYSVVQLAINRDFRVSAKVNRSRVDGIVRWRADDQLQFDNVWKTADVVPGDTVVTSEYSALFPEGIPIGTIEEIGPGSTGQFSDIRIQPQVDFLSLERVFIVHYKPSPERQRLEEEVLEQPQDAAR